MLNPISTESPIILVGTHRSGTTWLGSVLGHSRDVAYWVEPRHVWSYGNWFQPDDRLDELQATPKIAEYIRSRFSGYCNQANRTRLCEKTPSNCLRIPFVHSVFPKAKFIFLVRDGRAVFRSTSEILKAGMDWERLVQRIRETSIWDLPAFADRIPWMFRKLLGKPLNYWGVRPPGWKSKLREPTVSPMQLLAWQWSESIRIATEDFKNIPETQKLEIRYEDLLTVNSESERLKDFLALSDGAEVIKQLRRTGHKSSIEKWKKEIPNEILDEVKPIMEGSLGSLGYQW